jgi:hypothetical protein
MFIYLKDELLLNNNRIFNLQVLDSWYCPFKYIYRNLKEDFEKNTNQFLLNNILMSVQFFKHFERYYLLLFCILFGNL